jgi:ribosome recycling factor
MFDEKSYSIKMDKAIEVFSKELSSLRTGRANAAMLDYYYPILEYWSFLAQVLLCFRLG